MDFAGMTQWTQNLRYSREIPTTQLLHFFLNTDSGVDSAFFGDPGGTTGFNVLVHTLDAVIRAQTGVIDYGTTSGVQK